MKYMGSKKYMLRNGLGEMIKTNSKDATRIVDLFCGAGSVSWFAAEQTSKPVLAVDLQKYAVILTNAIIGRTKPIDLSFISNVWIPCVKDSLKQSIYWQNAFALNHENIPFIDKVKKSRELCSEPSEIGPIWNAYGGHYFSPLQAIILDHLIMHLPSDQELRNVCHAGIISAASSCAAAPGHTAQPFQPTPTAIKYLESSWGKDPFLETFKAVEELSNKHAMKKGTAIQGDALNIVDYLNSGDLIIIDPPYSEVQYSRFYHVLETVAQTYCGEVNGIGRYPAIEKRPQSKFSRKNQSKFAIEDLLLKIAQKKARIILTFPESSCSNGLSGEYIEQTAKKWFKIKKRYKPGGQLSSLGGNTRNRAARNYSNELILLMEPI